ncbi:myo-inositol-1(or 4)-monophosphatase [Renibacterium salmoninarum ATCC 33209]|uniref:Myo-inositol-1(Or 4)-monophosphatase n=1 Tax=Renibacterium salmoninarum (strain ATCC 33209 / DSM 20767 / JCM 11484 / NBRC 15589 / NCIMB 2235) TaxID=288705 RepID=A9WTZ2_RENSM|nr:inositol monophosphatase family protein [Renibacterium salmoninarum]ABY24663.1 myo-inositol-1(or 4)-monophosphatase [Renibacterium salmoninarum ATCC 33209]
MTEVTTAELLQVAKDSAAAGARVLAGRDPSKFSENMKSGDTDLVTEFDFAAESAVREAILLARPRDVITGEELAPAIPEQASGYRWSVDPLDGTMNFIRNIAYYCTSVAVAGPDGAWLAGVVTAPALNRSYFASLGAGAWVEEVSPDGTLATKELKGPKQQRTGKLLSTSLTYVPEMQARLIGELEARMTGFGDFRRLGSAALELCAIADGGLDAYLEYGLNEHDFAAGALIAEEAGAWVRRPELSSALNGLPPREESLAAWTAASIPELAGTFSPETFSPEG